VIAFLQADGPEGLLEVVAVRVTTEALDTLQEVTDFLYQDPNNFHLVSIEILWAPGIYIVAGELPKEYYTKLSKDGFVIPKHPSPSAGEAQLPTAHVSDGKVSFEYTHFGYLFRTSEIWAGDL
jgi:hypothetical protein